MVARPANVNRLFSTCSASQQWKRPDMEMKYYTDPEWRRHYIDVKLAIRRRRLQNDPEERDRLTARSKAWRLQNGGTEFFKRKHRLIKWCFRHSWVRQKLPWKTHMPEVYGEKVEHRCTGCTFVRKNGSKLWWRHIDQARVTNSLILAWMVWALLNSTCAVLVISRTVGRT